MTNRQFEGVYNDCGLTQRKDKKLFRMITLTALPIFWIGYAYALYKGSSGNISSYSLLIMAFSIMNADVLFTGEKLQNAALNIYAKILGLLFFVWTIITIASIALS